MSDPNRPGCRGHSCTYESCPRSPGEDGELLRCRCICHRRCYIGSHDDYDDESYDRCNTHCRNVSYGHCHDCRFYHNDRVSPPGSKKPNDSAQPDETNELIKSAGRMESAQLTTPAAVHRPDDSGKFAEPVESAGFEAIGDPVGAGILIRRLEGWAGGYDFMESAWPEYSAEFTIPMDPNDFLIEAEKAPEPAELFGFSGLEGWPEGNGGDIPMEQQQPEGPWEGYGGDIPMEQQQPDGPWEGNGGDIPMEQPNDSAGADGFNDRPETLSDADRLIERTWPADWMGSGILIPFSSGPPVILTCLDGGSAGFPAFVGFGSSAQGLAPLGDFIDLTNPLGTLTNFAFQIPRAGTVTSFGAYFNTEAAISIPAGFLTVTAQLYQSQGSDHVFHPIEGTGLSLSPALCGVVAPGMVLTGTLTGLSIPLTPLSRLMLVYSVSGTEGALATALTGCASAGLAIN